MAVGLYYSLTCLCVHICGRITGLKAPECPSDVEPSCLVQSSEREKHPYDVQIVIATLTVTVCDCHSQIFQHV